MCVQDGRIKVGDRIVAVADEPVAGLSADTVENTGGSAGRAAPHRTALQGQTDSMIYESSF